MNQKERSRAAAALGRRGGLKGGKARAASLGKEERRAIARKGAAVTNGGMKLPLSLVTKLASIVVHADEWSDPATGHACDYTALRGLVQDREVREWVERLGPLAPVKR